MGRDELRLPIPIPGRTGRLALAGSARTGKSSAYTPKGATGVGVRTLLAYLTDRGM